MEIRPRVCERAAQFVSLELDGELSLFERAMLKRHLHRCEPCAAYARDVTGLTGLLRAAPVEQIRLPIAFSLQRRRVSRVLPRVAATAAVAAVGIWFGISSLGNLECPHTSAPSARAPASPSGRSPMTGTTGPPVCRELCRCSSSAREACTPGTRKLSRMYPPLASHC